MLSNQRPLVRINTGLLLVEETEELRTQQRDSSYRAGDRDPDRAGGASGGGANECYLPITGEAGLESFGLSFSRESSVCS